MRPRIGDSSLVVKAETNGVTSSSLTADGTEAIRAKKHYVRSESKESSEVKTWRKENFFFVLKVFPSFRVHQEK